MSSSRNVQGGSQGAGASRNGPPQHAPGHLQGPRFVPFVLLVMCTLSQMVKCNDVEIVSGVLFEPITKITYSSMIPLYYQIKTDDFERLPVLNHGWINEKTHRDMFTYNHIVQMPSQITTPKPVLYKKLPQISAYPQKLMQRDDDDKPILPDIPMFENDTQFQGTVHDKNDTSESIDFSQGVQSIFVKPKPSVNYSLFKRDVSKQLFDLIHYPGQYFSNNDTLMGSILTEYVKLKYNVNNVLYYAQQEMNYVLVHYGTEISHQVYIHGNEILSQLAHKLLPYFVMWKDNAQSDLFRLSEYIYAHLPDSFKMHKRFTSQLLSETAKFLSNYDFVFRIANQFHFFKLGTGKWYSVAQSSVIYDILKELRVTNISNTYNEIYTMLELNTVRGRETHLNLITHPKAILQDFLKLQ